jgi:hypothetical protein
LSADIEPTCTSALRGNDLAHGQSDAVEYIKHSIATWNSRISL